MGTFEVKATLPNRVRYCCSSTLLFRPERYCTDLSVFFFLAPISFSLARVEGDL